MHIYIRAGVHDNYSPTMTVLKALFMISMAVPCAWGVFDGRDDRGPRPGDQFPVTGNLLQCFEDDGAPLIVGLNVTWPGDVFKPLRSRYVTHYSKLTICCRLFPIDSAITT